MLAIDLRSESTYLSVRPLIMGICHNIGKRCGIHMDDLESEANEAYMDAVDTFDPERGCKFATHVHWKVSGRLRNLAASKRSRGQRYEDTPVETVCDPHSVESESLLESLSEDAKMALQLVFETPAELKEMITAAGGHPRNIRTRLRYYLRSNYGWTKKEVSGVFAEIQEALQG